MNKTIDLKTGKFAPTPVVYVGYLFALLGLFNIFTKDIGFVILLIIGVGFGFTHFGILIDKEKDRYKIYTSAYWIKFGKWESLADYPYLTVLEATERRITRGLSNTGIATKNKVYRVTLLNNNHYKKILLKQLKDKDKAHELAEELARKLEIEKVIYSPG